MNRAVTLLLDVVVRRCVDNHDYLRPCTEQEGFSLRLFCEYVRSTLNNGGK
jgi:hypothetical protein